MPFDPRNSEFDWSELLESFIESTEDNFRVLEENLLQLERDPKNSQIMEEVLRRAHNLKGTAYTIGFEDVGNLAHRIEDVFKDILKGEKGVSERLIEALLGVLDLCRKLVKELETRGQVGDHSVEIDGALCTLEQSLGKGSPNTPSPPEAKADIPCPPLDTQSLRISAERVEELLDLSAELLIAQRQVSRQVDRLLEQMASIETLQGPMYSIHQMGPNHQEVFSKSGNDPECQTPIAETVHRIQEIAEAAEKMNQLVGTLEGAVLQLQLIPTSTLFSSFRRLVRDLARQSRKQLRLVEEGGETLIDRKILEALVDPFVHLIRNVIDHGIEEPEERKKMGKPPQGTLFVRAFQDRGRVIIEVEDDGRGLDLERIRQTALERGMKEAETMGSSELSYLIFTTGFSTRSQVTRLSGQGVGLSVVKENVEKLGGTVEVHSQWGKGTRFVLNLPLTRMIAQALLVTVGSHYLAIPTCFVEKVLQLDSDRLSWVHNQKVYVEGNQAFPWVPLASVLNIPTSTDSPQNGRGSAVLVSTYGRAVAFQVDTILEEQDICLRPLSEPLERTPYVSATTLLPDGQIGLVLDIPSLIDLVNRKGTASAPIEKPVPQKILTPPEVHPSILVVEDDLVTQQLEKSILEAAGYAVETARDGIEALEKLSEGDFQLVITDINMPRMDGFTLTERIRHHPQWSQIPVIIVSSRGEEADKRRGVEVGADAYIVKSQFSRGVLIDTVQSLIGDGRYGAKG